MAYVNRISVSCPACLSKADHIDDIDLPGNPARPSMGHAMYHSPEGPTALCIIPTRTQAAARILGRKGGQARSKAKTAAVRRNATLGGRPRTTYYEAVARFDGHDAGIVCSALTKEACRELARTRTTMSVRIRRVVSTPEAIAALKAVGKL